MGCDIGADKIIGQSFPGLTPEEQQTLLACFVVQRFPQDAHIMDQNDLGDFMAIVLDGKLAIRKETVLPGKFTLIAILEKGAMVGEVALAEETVRTASVISMEECSLLVLSRERALELFEDQPVLGVKVLKRILKVVGGRLQLASARLAQLL